MLNLSARSEAPDVTKLSDTELLQQLADQAKQLGLSLDALLDRGIDPGPAELRALCDRALEASMDALPDHAALKLGECTADLKHQLACRCGRVDRLLVEVQVDAAGLQRLDRA